MHSETGILKDIVANTPMPIAVYRGDELIIELINNAMIDAWGKGDQLIGKKYLEVLPEVKNEVFFTEARNVLKTGIPFHENNKKVELFINGKLKTHYFNYSFIPLLDAEGNVYAVMNTGVDVTDLYLAKQQIQSTEERLRIAIESSGIGTYEIDLATNDIKTCNNFNTIFSLENAISRNEIILKLLPDDLPVREEAFRDAEKAETISYETKISAKDNSLRWVKINGRILYDENNVSKTIIGTVQDIQEHKQFEDELKKQVSENTEELKRSNDDLLHFANIVSHDLREPVRKIKIFNNLIRNEMQASFSDKTIKQLDKINQSADRMQSIIEGILSYSTLDNKRQIIEKINLNEIIENIKTDLELIVKEKKAVILSNNLPVIQGAPILINQLFLNIIHNALKFSKPDEPPKINVNSILIHIDEVEFVQITITDNGIGLDEAYAERIFNTFERLHSKDQYEGNGLGLSLCRKIAHRHHGFINAKGKKEDGAEFVIQLPLLQAEHSL